MGRYIEWDDVTLRYPEIGASRGAVEVNCTYIVHAENRLDAMLASHFSVPFSSNNMTAKDLSIDLAYVMLKRRTNKEEAKEISMAVKEFVQMLKDGQASMVTTSGDVLQTAGDVVYSTTQGYTPVFGLDDIEEFRVDSSQLHDEEIDREY